MKNLVQKWKSSKLYENSELDKAHKAELNPIFFPIVDIKIQNRK